MHVQIVVECSNLRSGHGVRSESKYFRIGERQPRVRGGKLLAGSPRPYVQYRRPNKTTLVLRRRQLLSEMKAASRFDGVDGPRYPSSMCHNVVVGERHNKEEPSVMQAITIGLDIAKHRFQVHGVDAVGEVVVRRKPRRAEVVEFFRKQEPCLVGIEACATAHYWARELMALGHEVKLMPLGLREGLCQAQQERLDRAIG
jgi:hypothetical protein